MPLGRQGKLCLVLDLDHTLLNSATFAEVAAGAAGGVVNLLESRAAAEAANLPPEQRQLFRIDAIKVCVRSHHAQLQAPRPAAAFRLPAAAALPTVRSVAPAPFTPSTRPDGLSCRCGPSCAPACASSCSAPPSTSSCGFTPTVCVSLGGSVAAPRRHPDAAAVPLERCLMPVRLPGSRPRPLHPATPHRQSLVRRARGAAAGPHGHLLWRGPSSSGGGGGAHYCPGRAPPRPDGARPGQDADAGAVGCDAVHRLVCASLAAPPPLIDLRPTCLFCCPSSAGP